MSDRTHFRCRAYGLLSVVQCQLNRKKRERLACGDCAQKKAVDAGVEPTLSTLDELERRVGPAAPPRPQPPPQRPARPAAAVPPAPRPRPAAPVTLQAGPKAEPPPDEAALPETAANWEEATRFLNRARHWTGAELELLRREYPAGDLDSLCAKMGRKRHAVLDKAAGLGLKRTAPSRRRQSKLKHPLTPEIEAEIRRVYQRPHKSDGAVRSLAKRIGRPRWWVSRQAIEMGLVTARKKEPQWAERELSILRRNAMLQPGEIQYRLKARGYSRSVTAIVLKRKRMQLTSSHLDGYSATSLAGCMGVDGHAVTNWIERGWLNARRRGTARTAKQGGDTYWIEPKAVRRFILEYLEIIDLAKVDKTWFVDLITGGKIGRVEAS